MEPRLRAGGELGHGEAGCFACVDREDARAAGVGDDRDAGSRRERLRVEQDRDVEHLVDRRGADDAGLME